MVTCKIVAGGKRTPLIGTYLPPSTLEHLPYLEDILTLLWYQEPILSGELNADIGQAQNPCSQHIEDLLMKFGLVDLIHHFRQCWWFHHIKTWSHVQQGIFLEARCDYILRMDQRLFYMVGIKGIQNYSSDHLPLQARLLQHPTWCHMIYLWGCRAFPQSLPASEYFIPVESKF